MNGVRANKCGQCGAILNYYDNYGPFSSPARCECSLTAEPQKLYRHVKTGRVYLVTGFATHSETAEELVIYRCWEPREKQVWARPRAMFEDGRFEPLE